MIYRRQQNQMLAAFGQAVKAHRKDLGLSQEELARRAGLNRTYITEVERGIRNIALVNIVKLAKALNVRASDLLSCVDQLIDE